MRAFVTILVAAVCIGAAFAQEEDAAASLTVFEAEYERQTGDARSMRRSVPGQMIRRGQSGVAHLCCTPREDRRLDCRVALEWPSGDAFGSTALRFVEQRMRLTPASYEQFYAQPQNVIHLPVEFRMLPVQPRVETSLQEIAERSQNLCGAASEPAAPISIAVGVESGGVSRW